MHKLALLKRTGLPYQTWACSALILPPCSALSRRPIEVQEPGKFAMALARSTPGQLRPSRCQELLIRNCGYRRSGNTITNVTTAAMGDQIDPSTVGASCFLRQTTSGCWWWRFGCRHANPCYSPWVRKLFSRTKRIKLSVKYPPMF